MNNTLSSLSTTVSGLSSIKYAEKTISFSSGTGSTTSAGIDINNVVSAAVSSATASAATYVLIGANSNGNKCLLLYSGGTLYTKSTNKTCGIFYI